MGAPGGGAGIGGRSRGRRLSRCRCPPQLRNGNGALAAEVGAADDQLAAFDILEEAAGAAEAGRAVAGGDGFVGRAWRAFAGGVADPGSALFRLFGGIALKWLVIVLVLYLGLARFGLPPLPLLAGLGATLVASLLAYRIKS